MVIDPIAEIECESIVRAIDVSPDGKWMAWGGDDGVIRILDVSGQPTTLEPFNVDDSCLLYTSPSPRDATLSRMPSSA